MWRNIKSINVTWKVLLKIIFATFFSPCMTHILCGKKNVEEEEGANCFSAWDCMTQTWLISPTDVLPFVSQLNQSYWLFLRHKFSSRKKKGKSNESVVLSCRRRLALSKVKKKQSQVTTSELPSAVFTLLFKFLQCCNCNQHRWNHFSWKFQFEFSLLNG